MRKVLLPAILLGVSAAAFAQTSLREVVRDKGGMTKHFVTLRPDQQTPFSEKVANTVLNFGADLSLSLKKTETDELGNTNYRFYQTYKGIPVEGAMYIVQTKGGKATAMSGTIVTDASAAMKNNAVLNNRSLSKSITTLIESLLNYIGASTYAWQDQAFEQQLKEVTKNPLATYKPTAKLVWFNKSDDNAISPENLVLAYKIDVYALQPLSRAYYFVDAQTGEVIGVHSIINYEGTPGTPGTANTYYSGSQKIISTKDSVGTGYILRDYTKGNGIITLHGDKGLKGSNYTSTSANWNLSGKDQAAMDVHYGVSATWTFYKNVFKRNSYDDKGTALVSYVNLPGSDNAFWDGSAMNYYPRSTGDNGGTTGIDVTGHELTHGVTQETSELVYANESGAINESMSDIFGKSVQFYTKPNDINWQLSNDMNWIIRDMSNPNLVQQPDTYNGKYWHKLAKSPNIFNDDGGVHTNSGIGNFMYYLLVTGGTGTNDSGYSYNVKGIGNKAVFIMYRTNTTYLFPTATYADWRAAAISSATDLYGANSQAVKSVQDAFHAIGVGPASATSAASALPVAELKVSPNPVVSSSSVVSYQLLAKGNAVMTITDVNSARTVQTIALGNQEAGKYTYRLVSGATLPVGNYVLSIAQNGIPVSKTSIMVVK